MRRGIGRTSWRRCSTRPWPRATTFRPRLLRWSKRAGVYRSAGATRGRAGRRGADAEEPAGARSQETTQVLGRTQALILLAFAAILLALAAYHSSDALRPASGGGWVASPARWEVVGRVRRGMLAWRGVCCGGYRPRSTLWVAQSVLQAYVFEGGGLLEKVFPSRAEEL